MGGFQPSILFLMRMIKKKSFDLKSQVITIKEFNSVHRKVAKYNYQTNSTTVNCWQVKTQAQCKDVQFLTTPIPSHKIRYVDY